jgi:hypothetical protein
MQSIASMPQYGNYFDGYEIRPAGVSCVHIVRRFVPVWAIVVAIVGFFFMFLGLLVLLVRETEVLAVTVYERDGGSYVDFSGAADPKVASAVNFTVDRLVNGAAVAPPNPAFPPPYQGYPPAAPPPASYAPAPSPGYATAPAAPGTTEPGDGKVCPECAETIRAAARSCRFCGHRFDGDLS